MQQLATLPLHAHISGFLQSLLHECTIRLRDNHV